MRAPRWTVVPAALMLAGTGVCPAHAAGADPACAELAGVGIPASVMSLPTSGGRVTSATFTSEAIGGETIGYCRVDAEIHPVDPAAPAITMRAVLPADWNSKALMFGGGGYDGTVPDVAGDVPFGPAAASVPLARRYAVFASDSGHRQDPARPSSLDGSFARNDEALRNFAAGDALRKTRDASLFLIRRAYGAAPVRTYFAGGSTGGREALVVAQRWPAAFDGVISAYPAWNNLAEVLYLGHLTHVLSRPGAFPGPAKQALLHDKVIAACDGLDGLADGVIGDPAGCRFDPGELRCPDGTDTGDTCLSDAQIDAVVTMSTPVRWPYRVASGETGYPGLPFLSGADMRTPFLGFGTAPPADPMPVTSGYGMQYWDQWVKHFLTRDPAHSPFDVDPLDPGPWLDRISLLSTVQDRNDADLRPFADAGGKLLLLHGAADELVSERSTSDYYRRVRATVGARRTGEFLRYYVVPGADHANAGTPAFAAGWDSLTALERWVETGRPPRREVVTDLRHDRTRPLCEFPGWPRYRAGDPDRASSFVCTR